MKEDVNLQWSPLMHRLNHWRVSWISELDMTRLVTVNE